MQQNKSESTVSPASYKEKVKFLVQWLEEKQGEDIVAIDVTGLCMVTDAMLVVTAQTRRHAKALADHMLARAGESGFEYLGMEGYANAIWILVDLNDVLVHIFQKDERRTYDIEGLWSEGKTLHAPAEEAERK
ncbi:MAG: ribosome silencing factor [Desulfovibrionales bacterium]